MKDDNLSKRVIEYILSRKNDELAFLSNTAIAREFGINRISLCTRFRKDQDVRLQKYIQREKIYRAFFMIEKNNWISDSKLSKKLGFRSPGTFNREFKSIFLICPKRYLDLKRKCKRIS